ncbi:hypothetical protein ACNQFN_06195 [Thauera butanivorans]|uniref:hypothetical protein n=1 Tax=Thauera butanivorans TaxID=86174 RepID=UPI003AB12872
MSAYNANASSFDGAAGALDLGMESFWFNYYPAKYCGRLAERIKLTAKLLARSTGLQQSKALEAVARAVHFPSWHDLSAHLARGTGAEREQLPNHWLNALSEAFVLMVEAEDEVALPSVQLDAFERFGGVLTTLTGAPKQLVLNSVCAVLCGGPSWEDVRARSPLKARQPLYEFIVPNERMDAQGDGFFASSPACRQLTGELDERWQGYEQFTKAQKRRARQWVESALAAQPGFLEGGLALAWMQHDAHEPESTSTVNRFIKQADALIPPGYKGRIVWGHLGNRIYHRLLWLSLKLHHEAWDLPAAARVARKQLKLNPNDNLGVRYALPLILLERGEHAAARRAMTSFKGEAGLTAAAIRAFVEYALGNGRAFRRELAMALFTLPWMRIFLLNQQAPLPDGDDGFRGVHPDLETFVEFAWPAYGAVPGLCKACEAFLAEPEVRQAEGELRQYWKGFWQRRDGQAVGTHYGWGALVRTWADRFA